MTGAVFVGSQVDVCLFDLACVEQVCQSKRLLFHQHCGVANEYARFAAVLYN